MGHQRLLNARRDDLAEILRDVFRQLLPEVVGDQLTRNHRSLRLEDIMCRFQVLYPFFGLELVP